MATPITEKQARQIAASYLALEGASSIGRREGRSLVTIQRVLREQGVALRPVGRPPRVPTPSLIEAYERFGSLRAAAESVGMSTPGLRYRLAKVNAFPTHPGSEAAGIEAALKNRVVRAGSDDCWIAQGPTKSRGYVNWSIGNGRVYAHRAAWEQANGRPVPEGMQVVHRCDRPPCCNPAHLSVATPGENARQMLLRGRCGGAKLTPDQACEIRRRCEAGEDPRIVAADYPVGLDQVRSIASGRSWRL